MQILNIGLTGLLVIYVVCRQKQYGTARACVMGTGFFVVAFYLDSIFNLIMENAVTLAGNTLAGETYPALDNIILGIMAQSMGIFLSKSILIMLLISVKATGIVSDGRKSEDSKKSWQYLDGLTEGISLFSLILGFVCLSLRGKDDFWVALRLFFLLVLLLTYYISFYLHQKKQYSQRMREEAKTQEREDKLYLKTIEDQYQRTRELWHDLKNHISLLNLLLQEEKYEKMADYLRIFGDDIDSLTLPMKSGNLVVDALLADKVARAKRENIQVELSLCDLTELSLKPDEICSLLGNLLDNALEANRQLAEGRFLSIECRKTTDSYNRMEEKILLSKFYYIKVQNAIANDRNMDVNAIQGQTASHMPSPKNDRRNQVGHGLGMRSIERVVHACGGELVVERTESRFTAVVRLPG